MHSLHILLLGFNKKDADKLQKKLGNSFTLIRADENINLKEIKLILQQQQEEDTCNSIDDFLKKKKQIKIPVVLFSNFNEKLILECLKNGVNDFIIQDWSGELIKAKLKALINFQKIIKSSKKKIKIGALTIFLKKKKVIKKNKEIDLTKIEYDILSLLVSDRTKIFSREEIYEHIWGRDVVVGDRTLDVHMNNLRKKIGKNKIRTKKGIGFGINPDL